ncbi:MAG TPA: SDR family NAD(P)-dependent oxidoreductase [Ignavibacteria bacterium]|nr:SDR family NAD(P)-dependent oxidoreductase [Ignavibacteria bacterium]
MKNNYKNVLLTGASQGIGKALAYEYAKHGSSLVICSRSIEELKKISDDIKSNKGTCYYFPCDVSKFIDVSRAVSFAHEKLGTIDLAILNSGIGFPQWMSEFKSDDFKKVMEINAFGIAHALEMLIPVMKHQGYGTIAGVSSMADVRGYIGSSGYNASKAAASVLLESARVELKSQNIKVINVRPGFVKTAMTDKNEFYMPLLMQPDKAAKIIRKGIGKGKSIVQFPWSIVLATRIIKNIPNWLFDWGNRIARPGKEKR